MQRKICPVCDHVMKYSHYCHFCKQWVSNPNIINATYYLNERHPAHETDCEYHAPSFRTDSYRTESGKTGPKGLSSLERDADRLKGILKQNTAGNTRPGRAAGNRADGSFRQQNGRNAARNGKQRSPLGNVVFIIVLIFFLMTFISTFLPILFFVF